LFRLELTKAPTSERGDPSVHPSSIDGHSPALVAIVGASAVAYLALYISNGLRPMTTVALLGTLSALVLTVALASLFTALAHFTGAQSEDALLVSMGVSHIDLRSLVLAGMALGALGALKRHHRHPGRRSRRDRDAQSRADAPRSCTSLPQCPSRPDWPSSSPTTGRHRDFWT
jgi:hypothetical protein